MSKPESAGAKSLEEILSSIRRSLADEAVDRPGEPKGAAAKPAQPANKPVFPAPAEDAGLLPGKLAGALNRSSANGPALDDDLSELLAPEPQKQTGSVSAQAAKPSDAGSEVKDPLWFLTPKPAAPENKSNGAQASPGHARAADETRPSAAEEVKLSRPEILRASLPPLFGVAADAGKAADIAALLAKTPLPPSAAEMGEAKFEPEAAAPTAPAIEKSETASVSLAALDLTEASSDRAVAPPATPFAADPAAAEAAAPASVGESAAPPLAEVDAGTAPDAEVEPVAAPLVDGKSAPPPLADTKFRAAPAGAAAARAMPPGVPPPGALERTIAELLEPVIRNWLDTNLPRMVEKVVREEVARALAAERDVRQG